MKLAIRSLVVLLLFETRGAFGAEGAGTTFWVAPSTFVRCATGEDFATELLRRSKHAWPGRAEDAGLIFRIELLDEPGVTRGRLTVRERDGRETVRVVPGADCREVIVALAVIAAVLVDPDNPSGNARVSHAEQIASRDSAKTGAPTQPSWGFGAGAGLLLQAGVAPSTRPGAGVEAHLVFLRPRVVSPLFALGAYYTLAEAVPTPSGTAELNWWAVRASACPLRWPEQSTLMHSNSVEPPLKARATYRVPPAMSEARIADTNPAPHPTPTHPAPVASAPPASVSIAEEVRAIESARQALGAGRARDALADLQRYQARWPSGVFSAEALVLRVQAKIQLGDRASAVREANKLINAQPNSRHASRLRALLGNSVSK